MRIEINVFKYVDSYGFSYHIGKRWGNYHNRFIQVIAKGIYRVFGTVTIINRKI